jgi:hypothetical protein
MEEPQEYLSEMPHLRQEMSDLGVPQGAVTSPKLFNFYVSGLPPPPNDIQVVMYADDISIFTQDAAIQPMCDSLNCYVPEVTKFLEERGLLVSAEKSTVTLFTPWSKEAKTHPEIMVNGNQVPLERKPKILGVTHDTMYTFSDHCSKTAARMKQRNSVLKALTGTTWGQQKETLVMTYKAIWTVCLDIDAGNFDLGKRLEDRGSL